MLVTAVRNIKKGRELTMEKDYYLMNQEELIEKLKSKDEQITDLKEKYNCLKADTAKEESTIKKYEELLKIIIQGTKLENNNQSQEKLIQENENFKRSYYNSELSGLKAENELFKNTIVAMATYTYPGISNFDKIFRNINHNLEMIRKGR